MRERETVLVVDGGGRGAALVDKYAESPHVKRVIAVPGNDLMQDNSHKPVQIYPRLKTTSIPEILEICQKENVNLVDVAQDNAVEAGLVDKLQAMDISVVGPTKAAGQIEWSKAWAREFGERQSIPQPSFKICLSQREGIDYLKSQPDQPWFVKASGLAEGKGALSASNNKEAIERVLEMERFKDAGKVFLIEKWLRGDDDSAGEEFSAYILSDGENYKTIGSAQDYKRANDHDQGENTGSMGCNSPALVLTERLLQETEINIFNKAIAGLKEMGRPYKGVLYLGGMVIREGGRQRPYVIEFNARWGDPEAQAIVPGLINDFFEVGMAVANGDIRNLKLQTDGKSRVVVAGASKGYPGNYEAVKGKQIFGIKEARKVKGVRFYSAAIKENRGRHYANGGRLFYIVGEGNNVIEAQERAYEAMSFIAIEENNLHYRTDIGWKDIQRLRFPYFGS